MKSIMERYNNCHKDKDKDDHNQLLNSTSEVRVNILSIGTYYLAIENIQDKYKKLRG